VCYLDIETTGLSGRPLFLIGLMYHESERLVLDQLFARDYTEEPVILRFLNTLLARFGMLVTFNGVSFDVPYIRERMAVHGIELAQTAHHLDMLLLARGVLRGRTPNHRLQTLERYLLRRKRIGDVPGSEIPEVYHEFVRSGDAREIVGVIHHNRLDLLTMMQLVTVFITGRF
jgi:hypothetical protein